uniref:PH01B035L11.17 protein n=1 Tax=Phyllostachys edulis TaxID=38705 RepID=L0P2I7_PHYED|nr:PH01B035L11.17 [Phyllostachys edulis]
MTRFRIPSERVQGEHVLILGRLLHHLGAPFPEYFQEVQAGEGAPLIGVIITGISLNPNYYYECVQEWHSSYNYVTLQEVAHKAILTLRSHFSDQMRDSQFGEIPPIAPGSFGRQFGPSHTSSYPCPPLSPATVAVQHETTGTMILASTMLYNTTRGALARAEESSDF